MPVLIRERRSVPNRLCVSLYLAEGGITSLGIMLEDMESALGVSVEQ